MKKLPPAARAEQPSAATAVEPAAVAEVPLDLADSKKTLPNRRRVELVGVGRRIAQNRTGAVASDQSHASYGRGTKRRYSPWRARSSTDSSASSDTQGASRTKRDALEIAMH